MNGVLVLCSSLPLSVEGVACVKPSLLPCWILVGAACFLYSLPVVVGCSGRSQQVAGLVWYAHTMVFPRLQTTKIDNERVVSCEGQTTSLSCQKCIFLILYWIASTCD